MVADHSRNGPPDFVAVRDHVVESVVAFARALRGRGAHVPANAGIDATRALVEVGFDDRERVRAATRASLVTRREDVPVFERLFPAFWEQLNANAGDQDDAGDDVPGGLAGPDVQSVPPAGESPGPSADDEGTDGDGAEEGETIVEPAGADSTADGEGEKDQSSTSVYSPAGGSEPVAVDVPMLRGPDELDRPMRQLTAALAELRGRRWGRSGDDRVDVRRALRGSVGTGGTLVSVPTHARKRTAVRATLLVDVSQSVLDTIDREFLLRFLRRACDEWRSVRVFFFDTSVAEVTHAFEASTPRAALDALERAEAAWGGGTRIGNAIDTIRREHPDAVDRDTTTIVISDGLEVGEIDLLESGMSWLSARSGTVLWWNPLSASPEYEPTCRGMAVTVPYVDGIFAFTAPDDLTEIARQLRRRGTGGPIGYEYDTRRRS